MTNMEIIATEAALIGFPYNGENLFTFQEWKERGYSVKKGEHAIIKTRLWKPKKHSENKQEEGDEIRRRFFLANAALFSFEQVEPIKS